MEEQNWKNWVEEELTILQQYCPKQCKNTNSKLFFFNPFKENFRNLKLWNSPTNVDYPT
jgi:alpha-N-acetylglucosamine transferase